MSFYGVLAIALEVFRQCLEGAGGQRAVERLDVQPSDSAPVARGGQPETRFNSTAKRRDRDSEGPASMTVDLSEEKEEDELWSSEDEWATLHVGEKKGKGKRGRGRPTKAPKPKKSRKDDK